MNQTIRPEHPTGGQSDVRFAVIAVLLGLLLLANMVVIFLFSAENREESGDRSGRITRAVISVLHPHFDEYPPQKQADVREDVHHLVRKLAHFSEFAALGVLSAAFLFHMDSRRRALRGWWKVGISAGFCLAYAASDEIHQIFSGRGPAITDVLIDFSGSVTGIALLSLALWPALRHKQRRDTTA